MSVKKCKRPSEKKRFTFDLDEQETKLASEEGERILVGYASTFGGEPDSYNDIIQKGAFKRTLNAKRGRNVKFLWQHDMSQVIGIPMDLREDSKGLILKAKFANTTLGNEAYELAKMGAVDGLSIGFSTVKYEIDEESKIRTLTEIMLHEVSLVTFEANTNAKVTSVKSDSDLRQALIDLDYAPESVDRAIKELSLQDGDSREHSKSEPDKLAMKSELTRSLEHSINRLLII